MGALGSERCLQGHLQPPLTPIPQTFRRQELRELRVLQKEEQRAQSQLEQKFHQQREQMFRHIEQEMTVTGPSSLGAMICSERDTWKEVLGSHCGRCQGLGGVRLVQWPLLVPAAPLTISAWQSKKEFYDREVESSERRYRQLKERQELEYTTRLRDEAKRLKSLQEKDCRRRMQELKGDGKEVRVWGSAGSPGHATRSLGTVSLGCWDQAPPLLTAGAAVPAAAAGGTQRSPAEGRSGAQEEDDFHRLGVHQQDP